MGDKIAPDLLIKSLLDSLRQKGLLQTSGVENAFRTVPRHLFLPDIPIDIAYKDRAVALKRDRHGMVVSSASQPTMMAIMLQQLQLKPGDNVLEIGTATGYNAAIMKQIVGPAGNVTTLELDKDLTQQAQHNLQRAGIDDVRVVHTDGARGYAPRASYDHIVSTVGVWDIPASWLKQLKPGGKLVTPVWLDGVQVSAVFQQTTSGLYMSHDNRPCAFVYLRGEGAGPENRIQIGTGGLYLLSDDVKNIDSAALHLLLSDDHSLHHLESRLTPQDYWYGFQLYLMLNVPDDYLFAVYMVLDEHTAYGLEGRGVAIFSPAGAVFAPYGKRGVIHNFAGSDAYLVMQALLDAWINAGHPGVPQLRLCLYPGMVTLPETVKGKVYKRHHHALHVWMEETHDHI